MLPRHSRPVYWSKRHDARRHHQAPDCANRESGAPERGQQGRLRGGPESQQDRDPQGRRSNVRRRRGRGQHPGSARENEANGSRRSQAPQLEEGDRHAPRGRRHSVLRRVGSGSLRFGEGGITMGIRVFKPTSPGRRQYSCSDFKEITTSEPLKKLLESKSSSGGRNNYGRITSRFRGGGHKRRYRTIDFRRDKIGVPAVVAHIEYDPNRTARIALLHYKDGDKRYILAPDGLNQGDTIVSSRFADIRPGNSLPLRDIPAGTMIHNVELRKGRGGQLVRSAGVAAQLMAKDGAYAQVKLPSGEVRKVHVECRASVGQVSNGDHQNLKLGKAGRSRWL